MLYFHRLWVCLFLLLWVVLPLQAQPLMLGEQGEVLLTPHASVWRDASRQATVQEVAAKPASAFTPLDGQLLLGFTQDAVWLRFTLQRTADAPQEWWLHFDNAFLEDVRVYQAGTDGVFAEHHAGASLPRSMRDVEYPQLLFRLQVPVERTQTVYVRVTSRSAIAANLHLWQPVYVAQVASSQGLGWGAYYGMYGLSMFFYLVLWAKTRAPVHGWYVLYVGAALFSVMLGKGWVQMFLPENWQPLNNYLTWYSLTLAAMFVHMFSASYLDLRQHFPTMRRVYLGLAWTSFTLAMLAIVSGAPSLGMQIVQPTTAVLLLMVFAMACVLWWRGTRNAPVFLLAISFLIGGVVLRFGRNLGWVDSGFISAYDYEIGSGLEMLIFSVGLFLEHLRKRNEETTALLQARAEKQSLDEQRDFMAMVSHEFRTPLGVIGATTENLRRSALLGDKERGRCDKILRSNERLMALMDNYLSIERLQSADAILKKELVELVTLCRGVLEDFEDAPGAGIAFHPSVDKVLCSCDAGLLRVALRNLLHNARRHSPPGQAVRLELTVNGLQVNMGVYDEGAGVAPDELPHIFRRFYRGRNAIQKPGAGLGLHLVQKIMHRHGGTVDVQNLPGGGCAFHLQLPLAGQG